MTILRGPQRSSQRCGAFGRSTDMPAAQRLARNADASPIIVRQSESHHLRSSVVALSLLGVFPALASAARDGTKQLAIILQLDIDGIRLTCTHGAGGETTASTTAEAASFE